MIAFTVTPSTHSMQASLTMRTSKASPRFNQALASTPESGFRAALGGPAWRFFILNSAFCFPPRVALGGFEVA